MEVAQLNLDRLRSQTLSLAPLSLEGKREADIEDESSSGSKVYKKRRIERGDSAGISRPDYHTKENP